MALRKIMALVAASMIALFFLAYAVVRSMPVIVRLPNRPLVPTQNSFSALNAVASRIVHGDEIGEARLRKPKRVWSLAEKRALISENRDIIRFTHQALRLPYRETNQITSIEDDPGYHKLLLHLTRLLTLAGDGQWESGSPSDAVEYYLDAVTLGRKMPNRVGIRGCQDGLACETIGRSHLWRRLNSMDAKVARKVLDRLNAMEPERIPLSVAFEEEKYTAQSIVVEVSSHARADSPYGIVPGYVVNRILSDHMDKQIALTKRPYASGNQEIPPPQVLLIGLVATETQSVRFKFTAVQTGDVLLRTALAMRVYRHRTGKAPANLSDLVTAKLLPQIPEDPFAQPGTPLRYKALPEGKSLLYSIGPDCVDNGGRGIVSKSTKGELTHHTFLESKGDMIAGWDTY